MSGASVRDSRIVDRFVETLTAHFGNGPCTAQSAGARPIVEVLSPSTQGIDRREKELSYQKVASLEEYVLAAQAAREVTDERACR